MHNEFRNKMKAKLTQHGVSATTQRLDIAEVLFAAPQHLSAEQIIDQLKANDKHVSKATVYNTLNMFVAERLLTEVHVDPERTFYDSVTTPHYHFFNEVTRELTDIPADQLQLGMMPPLPEGTMSQGVDVVIRLRPAA